MDHDCAPLDLLDRLANLIDWAREDEHLDVTYLVEAIRDDLRELAAGRGVNGMDIVDFRRSVELIAESAGPGLDSAAELP